MEEAKQKARECAAKVPVAKLLQWSPFKSNVWGEFRPRITEACVREAVADGRTNSVPYLLHEDNDTRRYHVERIAYLVDNPWIDQIDIDVGCPALGHHVDWIIQDGHHRLAAAIIRGDEFISAYISGDLDYAKDLFGIQLGEKT